MLKSKLAFLFACLVVALSLNGGDAQNSFSFAKALRSKFNKALNSVSGHHGNQNGPMMKKLSAPLNTNLQRKQTAQLAQSQALNNHMRGPHSNNIMQDNQNQGSWLVNLAQQKHRSKLNDGVNLMNGLGSYHPQGLNMNPHHMPHHPPPMKQLKEYQKAVKSGGADSASIPNINMEEVQQADHILKLNAQKAQLDAFVQRKRTNGHYLNQFRNDASNTKPINHEPTDSNHPTKEKIHSRKLSIYKTLQEKEKNMATPKEKESKESLKVLSGVNGTSRNYDLFKELDLLDEFDNLKEEDIKEAEANSNNHENEKSLKQAAASVASASPSASETSEMNETPAISKEEYLESLKMFATRHRNPEHVFNEYRKFLAENR